MPATTRSKGQATLEDKGVSSSKPASKRQATGPKEATSKKQKTQEPKQDEKNENDGCDTILINRAPVLELWTSSVAHFLHPSLSWNACLSIGSFISTLAAISKGRSIGTMYKPDPGEQAEKREKRAEDQAELDEVQVMSFNLKLKDGNAMLGDKLKKGNEDASRQKFGDGNYEKVRDAMSEALKTWEGKEDELNERAFHMYEDFRPNVAAGQKGWGSKGALRLEGLKSAVES